MNTAAKKYSDDADSALDILNQYNANFNSPLFFQPNNGPVSTMNSAAATSISSSISYTSTQTTTSSTFKTSSAISPLADMIAHEVNGALNYSGALAVLQDAAASPMTAQKFSDLITAAKELNAAGGVPTSASVKQLFSDVVLGNSANAHWNGGANAAQNLGNLSATSTATQFNELIGKWFLGTDMPGIGATPWSNGPAASYKAYDLPLFSAGGPKLADVNQGQVGDCWFLSALGETAMQDPKLIQDLVTANGNGSYTIEFQVKGNADYVTVNNDLPTYSGNIGQYDGSKMEFANSTASLWVPLFEKGLAQLSEQTQAVTGLAYLSGYDQYFELNSGLGEGISLLTGQNFGTYGLAGKNGSSLSALLGQMHNDLAAGYDVLLGTSGKAVSGNLVDSHMFAVTSVDAMTGTIGLYNPWGANSAGDGKAASFNVSASTLVADQATFFAATGHATVS